MKSSCPRSLIDQMRLPYEDLLLKISPFPSGVTFLRPLAQDPSKVTISEIYYSGFYLPGKVALLRSLHKDPPFSPVDLDLGFC